MSQNPAIICLGYNRPQSLARLLESLVVAQYDHQNVPLIISLDHADDSTCLRLAESFLWPHGTKRVLTRLARLGLKQHVLEAGDLTQEFGAIIMLEDDIVVSPAFYQYACAALDAYGQESRIAGISLYSHRFHAHARRPFMPLVTGDSTFFLQYPCSWGQAWTREQWQGFRSWLQATPDHPLHEDLPLTVRRWSDSSWLKLFASYGLWSGKTWVYPYDTYTTNSADVGTHMRGNTTLYQVPLLWGAAPAYRFPKLGETLAHYDVYFENCSPLLLKNLGADVELDLYGSKPDNSHRKPLLITSRRGKHPTKTFGLSYKPWDVNVIRNTPGVEFSLIQREFVDWMRRPVFRWDIFTFGHPNRLSLQEMFVLTWDRLVRRIRRV